MAKEHNLATGISTNAIAHRRLKAILPLLDGIGIPVEGSTPEVNNAMRAGSAHHGGLKRAIGGILMSQEAGLPVTVRTVDSHKNMHDIPNIPGMLARNGVDLARIRHKLYQLTHIGPLARAAEQQAPGTSNPWAHPISIDDVIRTAVRTHAAAPSLDLSLQLYSMAANRYLQVGPDGRAYAVSVDTDNGFTPYEVELGNALEDYDGVVNGYNQQVYAQKPVIIFDGLLLTTLKNNTVPRLSGKIEDYLSVGPEHWLLDSSEAQAYKWLNYPGSRDSFRPAVDIAYDFPELTYFG